MTDLPPPPERPTVTGLRVVPAELLEANALVTSWHRHHQPAQGHRFSLAAVDDAGVWHGAVIVGRPVARLAGSPRAVLEVVRLVTDGTPNVCSLLYSAAARAGKAMGYERIQTYILDEERGTSLRASGWTCEGAAGGGQWKHTDGKARRTDQPVGMKSRWARVLNAPQPAGLSKRTPTADVDAQGDLFGGDVDEPSTSSEAGGTVPGPVAPRGRPEDGRATMSESSTEAQDAGSTTEAPDVVVEGDATISTGSPEGEDASAADESAADAGESADKD